MKTLILLSRTSIHVLRLTVRELSAYRLNFVLSFLVIALPFFLQVFFWKAVTRTSGTVGPYSLAQLITYSILALLLHDFAFPSVRVEIAEDIKQGSLSGYLIRPYPYPLYAACTLLGSHILYLGVVTLFSLVLIAAFRSLWMITWSRLAYFVLVFLFAWLLGMILSMTLSFAAFFLEDVWGLQRMVSFLVPLFSGLLLPLDLFPMPLQWISRILPFRWMVYEPIRVALGLQSPGLVVFVICGWLGVSSFLAVILWRKGLQIYTATGG